MYRLNNQQVYSDTMAATTGKRIMVVDDDKDITKVIELGLKRAGFQVHAFTDPILALEHIERGCNDCEILISDVKMPRLNGFQLAKRVRQIRPEIKLVMMTAFEVNKSEFESVFPSTKIDSVLRKPFASSKLLAIVERIAKPGAESQ